MNFIFQPRHAVIALLFLGLSARMAWMAKAPFPDHYWDDERFSAALATQPFDRLVALCAEDVHPPLYYLALKIWNDVGLALRVGDRVQATQRIISYRLPGIGREGYFTIQGSDGLRYEATGLYPADWARWPLTPLYFLRLLSIGFALAASWILFLIASRLTGSRAVGMLALALMLFSPFMMTWDTVIRSYSLMAFFVTALVLIAISKFRRNVLFSGSIAVLGAAALLTGYITILVFPAIVAVVALRHKSWKLAAWCTAGLLISILIFRLAWGRIFIEQSALRQVYLYEQSLLARFFDEFAEMAGLHWKMLFSYGVTANLNPFSSPAGYAIAFLLYATCIGTFLFHIIKSPRRDDFCLLILAVTPSVFAAALNTLRPETIPIQARYFYPIAPFFFLLLARGATLLGSNLASHFSRANRSASEPGG